MFDKIGRLAETAANNVSLSRRGFFGRLGQGALALTGVLGGLLAIPTGAHAAGGYVCCIWNCLPGPKYAFCWPPGTNCRYTASPCYRRWHLSQHTVSSCSKCY